MLWEQLQSKKSLLYRQRNYFVDIFTIIAVDKLSLQALANSSSTVVERWLYHPEVAGFSHTTATHTGVCIIKLLWQHCCVIIIGQSSIHLQSSFILWSRLGANQEELLRELHSNSKLLALWVNIRLREKWMAVTYTLPYYITVIVTAFKGFIIS